MSETVKKGVQISPFNCIALKDVKDKTTKKVGMRPLFDCVDSLQSCVDNLKSFLDESPQDSGIINGFLKGLTDVQLGLLDICQTKVSGQGEYVPQAPVEGIEKQVEPQVPEEDQKVSKPMLKVK